MNNDGDIAKNGPDTPNNAQLSRKTLLKKAQYLAKFMHPNLYTEFRWQRSELSFKPKERSQIRVEISFVIAAFGLLKKTIKR